MSLYNMLMGTNPDSPILLAIIDMDLPGATWRSGRFRNIYVDETGEKIILYTRNGGGNREHWIEDVEEGPGCTCTGCTITYHLREHPDYVRDWDDDFDSTYAYVEFKVPEKYLPITRALSSGEKPQTIHEQFEAAMEEMQTKTAEELRADPKYAPMIEVLDKIAKGEGGGVVEV